MKRYYEQRWFKDRIQEFLLSFFENNDQYQEKEINGFYLIRMFCRDIKNWRVGVYRRDTYRKMKAHKERINNLIKPRGNKQERG